MSKRSSLNAETPMKRCNGRRRLTSGGISARKGTPNKSKLGLSDELVKLSISKEERRMAAKGAKLFPAGGGPSKSKPSPKGIDLPTSSEKREQAARLLSTEKTMMGKKKLSLGYYLPTKGGSSSDESEEDMEVPKHRVKAGAPKIKAPSYKIYDWKIKAQDNPKLTISERRIIREQKYKYDLRRLVAGKSLDDVEERFDANKTKQKTIGWFSKQAGLNRTPQVPKLWDLDLEKAWKNVERTIKGANPEEIPVVHGGFIKFPSGPITKGSGAKAVYAVGEYADKDKIKNHPVSFLHANKMAPTPTAEEMAQAAEKHRGELKKVEVF